MTNAPTETAVRETSPPHRRRQPFAATFLLLIVVQLLALGIWAAIAPAATSNVLVWGNDSSGQLDQPPGYVDLVAVSASYTYTLGLRAGGTVVGWGTGPTVPPAGLTGVVAVSAGSSHAVALKMDGTVVGWGDIKPPAGLSGVVAVASGSLHSLALKSDGTVVGWGGNGYGQEAPPAGLADVVAIAAGGLHSLALKSDGTVVGWGYDGYGQSEIPAGLTDVVSISEGEEYCLALKSDGTVVGWGLKDFPWDDFGQADPPADLGHVVAVSAGNWHALALKDDGTVVGWGHDYDGEATVPPGLGNVTAIAAGGSHSVALRAPGVLSPVVGCFLPPLGLPGDLVTIYGSGLDGVTSVKFGDTPASFTQLSDTRLRASVPAGAATGPLTVTTAGGSANSAKSFKVPAPPSVTSISPATARVTDEVTILGSGFDDTSSVLFNGAYAAYVVDNDFQITATVPLDATSGPITVVTSGGSAESEWLTVLPPIAPTLTMSLGGPKKGTLGRGKVLTITGKADPGGMLAGESVVLQVQHLQRKVWVWDFIGTACIGQDGSFSGSYKPGDEGTYQARVTLEQTWLHTWAETPWASFGVR
jgi:hypothetical protein